uniref:Polyprotein n=1 Tax=Rhizoctonia solani endornavirus 9 TaxID=2818407 RepID=A0AAU6NDL9_9VIRU
MATSTHTQLPPRGSQTPASGGNGPTLRRASSLQELKKGVKLHNRHSSDDGVAYNQTRQRITKVSLKFTKVPVERQLQLAAVHSGIDQTNRGKFKLHNTLTRNIPKQIETTPPVLESKVELDPETVANCWTDLYYWRTISFRNKKVNLRNKQVTEVIKKAESTPAHLGSVIKYAFEQGGGYYRGPPQEVDGFMIQKKIEYNFRDDDHSDRMMLKITEITDNITHLESFKYCATQQEADELKSDHVSLRQAYQAVMEHESSMPKTEPMTLEQAKEKVDREHSEWLEQCHAELTFNVRPCVPLTNKNFIDRYNPTKKLGVSGSYLLRNKFFDQMEFLTDDANSKEYISAISSHDNRVVNNTWARNEFTFLKTTTPSNLLNKQAVQDLEDIVLTTDVVSAEDDTFRFLLDVCLCYSYLNCNPKLLTLSDEVSNRVRVQPYFKPVDAVQKHTLISLDPALEDAFTHNLTFIIGPVIGSDSEGYLPSKVGYYKTDNGQCIYSFGSSSITKTTTWFTKMLAGDNTHEKDGKLLHVVSRKVFDAMQVMVISPLYTKVTKLHHSNERVVRLPLLQPTSLWTTGVPIFKTVELKLNLTLLNRLINKNLTGKVGTDLLMEYGMALSWYSYNKRGVEISDAKLDPMDIKLHVYICQVLIRRQALRSQLESIAFKTGLNSVVLSTIAAIFEHNMNLNDIQNLDNSPALLKIIDLLKTPNVMSLTGEEMAVWDSIDVWTVNPTITTVVQHKKRSCTCHYSCELPLTEWICTCCNYQTATNDGGLCECCDHTVQCMHEIRPDNHIAGNVNCKCCNLKSEFEYCQDCTLTPLPNTLLTGVNPNQMAQRARKYNTRPKPDWPTLDEGQLLGRPSTGPSKGRKDPKVAETSREANTEPFKLELNSAELVTCLEEYAVLVTMGEMTLEDILPEREDKLSVIPFVIEKHIMEDVTNFEILDFEQATGFDDCGINCVRHYVGMDYSSTITKRVTSRTRDMDAHSLATLLNAYERNACIIEPAGVTFTRYDDSPKFAVIIHSTLCKDEDGKSDLDHWVVGHVRRIDMKNVDNYCYPMSNMSQYHSRSIATFGRKYSDLTPEEKLQVSFNVANDNQIKPSNLLDKFEFKDGWFRNGSKHDFKTGHFNFKIPEELHEIFFTFTRSFERGEVDDSLYSTWDDATHNLNLEANVTNAIRDCLLSIVQGVSNPIKFCRSTKVTIKSAGVNKYLDVSDTTLKNGDMILLLEQGVYKPKFITVSGTKVHLASTGKINNVVTFLTPKASFMSTIMKLYALLKPKISEDRLNQLIKQATLVYGYGGCGKTTFAAKFLQENDFKKPLAVACSSGGVESLKTKLFGVTPKSFELASYTLDNNDDCLIIDEASLIKAWELCLVCGSNVQKLVILGDTNQIPAIDLTASPGARKLINLLDWSIEHCDNKEYRNYTYRFNGPLVQELKLNPSMKDLEGKGELSTEFTTKWMQNADTEEVVQYFSECNVILCHYNQHVTKLKKMFLTGGIKEITTIHRYQGKEAPIVGVFQCPLGRGTEDLQLNYNYNVSAVTRATKKMKWLTVQNYSSSTPLHQRIGEKYGKSKIEFAFNLRTNEQIFEGVSGLAQPANHKVSWQEVIDSVGQGILPEQTVQNPINKTSLNRILKHFTPVGHVISTTGEIGSEKITFKVGWINKVVDLNDLEASPVPRQYHSNFLSAVSHSRLIDLEDEDFDYVLNVQGKYRVRMISYVAKVYQANGKSFTIHFPCEATILLEDTSCAACGAITFLDNRGAVLAKISKDYMTKDARTVTGPMANEFFEAMCSEDWKMLPEKFDDEKLSRAILAERINTWMKDVPNVLKNGGKWMYYDQYDNEVLAQQILTTINLKVRTTKVDNMDWYCFKKKGITNSKISYISDGKRTVVKAKLGTSLMDYIYLSLCEMYKHYNVNKFLPSLVTSFYMQRFGALDRDRLPGMVESIEWHKTHKTSTYYNLLSRMGKLKISSLRNKTQLMQIPTDVSSAMQHVHSKLEYNELNYSTMGDGPEQASDCLSAYVVSNSHMGETVSFRLNTTYVSFAVGRDCKNAPLFDSKMLGSYSTMLNMTYDRMLTNKLKHTPVGEEYNRLKQELELKNQWCGIEDTEIVVTGPGAIQDFKTLKSLTKNYMTIYFWLPHKKIVNNGQIFLHHKNSQISYQVHERLLNAIERGLTVMADGRVFKIHTVKTFDGLTLFRIHYNDELKWCTPWEQTTGKVRLTMPSLVLDPVAIMQKRSILETNTETYDLTVLGNLRRRLLRPGTTFDDLLVQARTLLNTAQFSTTSIFQKYNMDVAAMRRHAVCAMMIHEYENRSLMFLQSDSLSQDFKIGGLRLLGELFKLIIPTVDVSQALQAIPDDQLVKLTSGMASVLKQMEKLKPVLLHGRKGFVYDFDYNLLSMSSKLMAFIRQKQVEIDTRKHGPLELVVLAGCKNCQDKRDIINGLGLIVVNVSKPKANHMVCRFADCRHEHARELEMETTMNVTPCHIDYDGEPFSLLPDDEVLKIIKEIDTTQQNHFNWEIQNAIMLGRNFEVKLKYDQPVYVFQSSGVVATNSRGSVVSVELPAVKDIRAISANYNKNKLRVTNRLAYESLKYSTPWNNDITSVTDSAIYHYTRRLYDGTVFNEHGMQMDEGVYLTHAPWLFRKLKPRSVFNWGFKFEEEKHPGQIFKIGDLDGSNVQVLYNSLMQDGAIVDAMDVFSDEKKITHEVGQSYFELPNHSGFVNPDMIILSQDKLRRTENSFYHCPTCRLVFSTVSFCPYYRCENNHPVILVGHPLGMSSEFMTMLVQDTSHQVFPDEDPEVSEQLFNLHQDTLDHNAKQIFNTWQTAVSTINRTVGAEMLKDTIDLNQSNDPSKTLGHMVHTFTIFRNKSNLKVNGYLTMKDYKWIRDTHHKHWYQDAETWDPKKDMLPIKMNDIVAGQVCGSGFTLNAYGKLHYSGIGGQENFFCHMVMLSQLYRNPWILNSCPRGFELSGLEYSDYSCCTGYRKQVEMNTNDDLDDMFEERSSRDNATLNNRSGRSFALILAKSYDGLMCYGLAVNSWNMCRPFIGNYHHGSKANDAPLEIDTCIPVPGASRFKDHFTSWQGVYDNWTSLRISPSYPIEGSMFLPKGAEGCEAFGAVKEMLDMNSNGRLNVGWINKSKCRHPYKYQGDDRTWPVCNDKPCIAKLMVNNLHSKVYVASEFGKVEGLVIPTVNTVNVISKLSGGKIRQNDPDAQWYNRYMGMPVVGHFYVKVEKQGSESPSEDGSSDHERGPGDDQDGEEPGDSWPFDDDSGVGEPKGGESDQPTNKEGEGEGDAEQSLMPGTWQEAGVVESDETIHPARSKRLSTMSSTTNAELEALAVEPIEWDIEDEQLVQSTEIPSINTEAEDPSYKFDEPTETDENQLTNKNNAHFIKVIGALKDDELAELPEWYNEQNFFLSGKPIEIWTNPVLSARISSGKDLTSSNIHWISQKFTKGLKLDVTTVQSLQRLKSRINKMNFTGKDTIHIYSMHEGIAERNPAKVPGRHVCFTTQVEKYRQRGFEVIPLAAEPGRLGANLRLIFAHLVDDYKYIIPHGGRVNTHGIWVERVIGTILKQGEVTQNSSVSAWSTANTYMDGFIFTKNWNTKSAECINANISYWSIYGIDEAKVQWFDVKQAYINKTMLLPYSNVLINPELRKFNESLHKMPIPDECYNWDDLPMKYVNKSTYSASNVKLAWHHDGNVFMKETRGYTVSKDSEFEQWFEERFSKNALPPRENFGLKIKNTCNKKFTFKVNEKEIEFLHVPSTIEHCVAECFDYHMKEHRTDIRFDDVKDQVPFKALMNQQDIERVAYGLGVNLDVNFGINGWSVRYNDGPVLQLTLTSGLEGIGHCQVTKYERTNLIEENISFLGLLPDVREKLSEFEEEDRAVEAYFNDEGEVPNKLLSSEYLNAKQRLAGRIDLMMQRSNKIIECKAIRVKGTNYLRLANGVPGQLLLFRSEQGMEACLAKELDGKIYARVVGDGIHEWCIFTGATVRAKQAFKKTIKVQTKTFLTMADKQFALNNNLGEVGAEVGDHGDTWMLRNFDNRRHHNFDYRAGFYERVPDRIEIIGKRLSKLRISKEKCQIFRDNEGPYVPIIRDGFMSLRSNLPYLSDEVLRLICDRMLNDPKDIVDFCQREKLNAHLVDVVVALGMQLNELITSKGTKSVETDVSSDTLNENTVLMTLIGKKYPEGNYRVKVDVINYDRLCHPNLEDWMAMNTLKPNLIYSVEEGLIMHINIKGRGFMDYSLKTNVSVKVDEGVVDRHNTIEELSKPKPTHDVGKLDPEVVKNVHSVATLNNLIYNDQSDEMTIMTEKSGDTENRQSTVLYGVGSTSDPINGEPYRIITDAATMNYWDDETAMVEGTIDFPRTNIKLQSREEFVGYRKVRKHVMVNYPSHSQPAFTKRSFAGLQAVTDLFGSVLNVRQVEHNPKEDADLFERTYFKKGAKAALPNIGLNPEKIKEWLAARPDYIKISADLMDMLTSGMDIRGLDKVNVHMKLESRMKDSLVELEKLLTAEGESRHDGWNKMPGTIEEQRVRLIVWQRKGIAAIFSPFFMEIKDNLKRVLIDNVVYVDGLTPQQIGARLNQVGSKNVKFAEDDLKKQDRQTDDTLIDTEMEIYKKLAGNPSIINLWRNVHRHWRAKGVGVKFVGNAARHTGQATTAIGNAIVNLMVKRRLVAELSKELKLMMVLGDDNIILTTGSITEEQISLNSARHFNMVSEPMVSKYCGGFLRMVVFGNNVESLSCGPDVIRLRRRFEVMNGVSEANAENIMARTASYCMMLGDLKPVRDLVNELKLPVELSMWYDWAGLCNATAIKYKCTPEYVETELAELIKMMRERTVFTKEFLHAVSKNV